jgi:hypothetical protein
VDRAGIEPATSSVQVTRSNPAELSALEHNPITRKGRQGSGEARFLSVRECNERVDKVLDVVEVLTAKQQAMLIGPGSNLKLTCKRKNRLLKPVTQTKYIP